MSGPVGFVRHGRPMVAWFARWCWCWETARDSERLREKWQNCHFIGFFVWLSKKTLALSYDNWTNWNSGKLNTLGSPITSGWPKVTKFIFTQPPSSLSRYPWNLGRSEKNGRRIDNCRLGHDFNYNVEHVRLSFLPSLLLSSPGWRKRQVNIGNVCYCLDDQKVKG